MTSEADEKQGSREAIETTTDVSGTSFLMMAPIHSADSSSIVMMPTALQVSHRPGPGILGMMSRPKYTMSYTLRTLKTLEPRLWKLRIISSSFHLVADSTRAQCGIDHDMPNPPPHTPHH